MLLTGKIILVTGAARGLGAATCRVLAREGAAVVVNYSASADKAESLVREIVEQGGRALPVQADVRVKADVDRMVAQAYETFGRLDGVVNNAIGGTQIGKLDDVTDEDYRNAFEFGCTAVLNTIRAVRPRMAAQGGGRIINIVTELWNLAPAEWSVYMSGKGAMVGISRALANELGPENITVNMIAPGWMADEKVDGASQGAIEYAKTVPLRRQGGSEEIGNACAFFLSDLAGFITGAYLPVCGGHVTQAE